jgi:NAD(P)-dependent dehydrogenase (short-subunit alcohol dehydrogenase family)
MSTPAQAGKAVVIGVGAERGLGFALAQRLAREGMHVFLAGRTQARLDARAASLRARGLAATAVPTDTTDEAAVGALFDRVEAAPGALDLAIYNAGNNTPGRIAEMDAGYFERSWRIGCFGGFLFGREAVRRMLPRGAGTLLFTGASASLRGRANFGAFNAAKAGLRNLAQAMAKEYAADGIHIGHVVVDGGIAGDRIIDAARRRGVEPQLEALIDLDGLTEAFWFLHRQPRQAWTFELDVRTHRERW